MVQYAGIEADERNLDYYDELCRLRGKYMDDLEGRFLKAEAIKESGMDLPYGRMRNWSVAKTIDDASRS